MAARTKRYRTDTKAVEAIAIDHKVIRTLVLLCVPKPIWETIIIPMMDIYSMTQIWVFRSKVHLIDYGQSVPNSQWLEHSRRLETMINTVNIDFVKLQAQRGRVFPLSLNGITCIQQCKEYCRIIHKSLGPYQRLSSLDVINPPYDGVGKDVARVNPIGTRCRNLSNIKCSNKIAFEGSEVDCGIMMGFINCISKIPSSECNVVTNGKIFVDLEHPSLRAYATNVGITVSRWNDYKFEPLLNSASMGLSAITRELATRLRGLFSVVDEEPFTKKSIRVSFQGTPYNKITDIRDFEILSYQTLHGTRKYVIVHFTKIITVVDHTQTLYRYCTMCATPIGTINK